MGALSFKSDSGKNVIKYFSGRFLFWLLWPAIGFAQTQFTAEQNQAMDQFREALADNTKVLDRDIVVFHYSSGQRSPKNGGDVEQMMLNNNSFFGPGVDQEDYAGPGLYVATDPNNSRKYGRGDPQLFVMTLKRGGRVLDGPAYSDRLGPAADRLRQSFGCVEQSSDRVIAQVAALRSDPNPTCRRALLKVISDLKIQAISYGFGSSRISGCDPKRDENIALNIISTDIIGTGEVAYFDNQRAIDPKSIGGFVNRLFSENLEPTVAMDPAWNALPKTASSLSTDRKKYIEWKVRSIYKCGLDHFRAVGQQQTAPQNQNGTR